MSFLSWLFGEPQPKAPTPKRRQGIAHYTATGNGLLNKDHHYEGYYEVEEIERSGNLSKLKVLDVSGADFDMAVRIFPGWIESDKIIWKEDKL